MKNLSWKEIKELVEKEERYMEESYLKCCDSFGFKNDELDRCEEVENLRTRLREGGFIYNKGIIKQVLKCQNKLCYYDIDGYYKGETTLVKEEKTEKVVYRSDLIYICDSAITKKAVYGRYIDDELYTDFDGKIVDVQAEDNSRRAFINGIVVPVKNIFREEISYSRRGYGYSSSYISDEVDEKKINNYLPDGYEKATEKVSGGYSRDRVIFSGNNFYFKVGRWGEEYYKIPTLSKDEIFYAIVDGIFYYVMGDNKKECSFIRINDEYSEILSDMYIRAENGEVIFEDKPYSKYPRMYSIGDKDVIVIGYNQYVVDNEDFEFKGNKLINNNSPYTTVSEVKNNDVVIPYKSIFLVVSEDGIVSVYDRKQSIYGSEFAVSGIESYKNIKYGRKKSNFYVLDNVLYMEGNYYDYKVPLEEYKEKSIKVIHPDLLYIENINGTKELISTYGKKVSLMINLSKDILISLSRDMIQVVSFNEDVIDIQINKLLVSLKDGSLFYKDEQILDNVIYDINYNRDGMVISKLMANNQLKELSGKLEIPLNDLDKDCFNTWYKPTLVVKDEGESYIQFFNREKWNTEYIISKKDNCRHEFDFEVYKDYVVLLSENRNKGKSKGDYKKFIISGWHIDSMLLSKIYSLNTSLFNEVCGNLINNNCTDKNEFLNLVEKTTNDEFYKCVIDNDIKVSRKDFDNYVDNKDFIDIVLNLDNIRDHLKNDEYEALILEIEKQVKGLEDENSYISEINNNNVKEFINHGINIEKFNNYGEKIQFVARSAGSYLVKESLQEALFNQIQNLIGSRKLKQKGVLQISSMEDLINLGEKFYDEVALDLSSSVELKEKSNIKTAVREINKLGQIIYKFLKSYNTDMDYLNREIVVNGVRAVDMPLKKIVSMLNRFIFIVEGIQEKLKTININKNIINEVDTMLVWCIDHIKRDLDNIPKDVEDIKNPTLNIRLWDREDVIRNLTQGTRTHCCIALDSFNIDALVRYIFNKNMVLVEICDGDNIIGQAFVYMAVSNSKIDYKYENKRHIFMAIDNVEVNNNYSKYATDIGKNLQLFMYGFKNYVSSDRISDVILGTSYNDIRPPYKFTVDMDISVLGNQIYRDTSTRFYKFL